MSLDVERDGDRRVYTARRGAEVLGYVAIDSTVGGTSRGGLRMLPDVGEAELRGLARAMTLKYGFLGLPQGGAKAGVRGDPDAPLAGRRRCLARFAEAIAPLLRRRAYVPDADMGVDGADVQAMLQGVGIGTRMRERRGGRSGYYTALTVFTAAERALRHLGRDLAGSSVAIEGFGKVGGSLAALLLEANARVVAVSTSRGAVVDEAGLDVRRLTEIAARHGSRVVELYPGGRRIDRAELLTLPVDVLSPCARHGSVNRENAALVLAAVICPGANDPVTPEAERALHERGVVCVPDFVANCGGVLGGTMEFASIRPGQVRALIRRGFGTRIDRLLERAADERVLPREIATRQALQRFDAVRRRAEHPSLRGRAFAVALEAYRRGWAPGGIVARLSMPYFERALTA